MKYKTILFIFPLILALFAGGASRASACSCVPSAPCQNYDRADVVFAGKVVGSKFQKTVEEYDESLLDKDGDALPNPPKKVTYDVGEIYFEVAEAFRGGAEKGARLTIYSNTGGGDCGFWFKRGETYVVFASKEASKSDSGVSSLTGSSPQNLKPDAGRLWTTICAGTRDIKSAADALAYLRDIPKPGSGGMIIGRIDESINDYSAENLTGKPLVGAKVRADGITGVKRSFFGTTDKNGYFEIRVPPGAYSVAPVLEPNLAFSESYNYEEENAPVKIEDTKCETRIFQVTNDSEISGKALNADGTIPELFALDLFPADKERGAKNFNYKFAITEANGAFSFKGIPPGRYILALNYTDEPKDDSPFPTTFYPRTAVRKEARVIEIGLGTKIKDIVFQMPSKLTKRKITGTVVWKNGKPAAGAEIRLHDIEFDETVSLNKGMTNARGEFSVEWFAGRRYKIKVIVWEQVGNSGAVGVADAETGEFTLDEKTGSFRIVLEKQDPRLIRMMRRTVRAN